MPETTWTQDEAIALCVEIESFCPDYGCHVALTGGLLYKTGRRKDADILFYSIRQQAIDIDGLLAALENIGIAEQRRFGWCVKASKKGKSIDLLFPEIDGGDYPEKKEEIIF